METNIIESKTQIDTLKITNKPTANIKTNSNTNNSLSEFQQILYKLSNLSIQIEILRAEINDLKNQRNFRPELISPFQHTYRSPPQCPYPNYI
jgi:hypothetical protein